MVLSGTLILNSGFDEYRKLCSLYLLYGLFSLIFACVLVHACYCMHDIACVILQEYYNQEYYNLFKLLFGLHLCKKILLITDNLSKTLQKHTLSATEGQEVARLTITTLKGMRTDEAFNMFFELVEKFRDKHDVGKSSLPRKIKAPHHLEVGTGEGYHSTSV